MGSLAGAMRPCSRSCRGGSSSSSSRNSSGSSGRPIAMNAQPGPQAPMQASWIGQAPRWKSLVARAGPDAASSSEEDVAGTAAALAAEAAAPPSDPYAWKIKKSWMSSDGASHVGSTLLPEGAARRPFPGPPPDEGAPLRVLPIGGLGEIGMNCMLVGCKGRYILVDAGLLFPDFQDFGMQKILPDVSFLAQWRDKIEAVVITHGHEDHIGALPWVIPALDPSTPVYAGAFVMQLISRRLHEFNLYSPQRFHTIDMLQEYQMGPFTVTPIRVTHSIPDCCGLIMRSEHGTIVHTGDWKIDEAPVDGEVFDRETFDLLSKEPIALMMSDSTNVLTPGRTPGERIVQESLCQKVLAHEGKGRVVVTQFASNLHRLASVKAAADAAGRSICFIGTSLNTYLEAAHRVGRAPINPAELVSPHQLPSVDPSKVLVVTTGSQAEPRAQLSLASRSASNNLKIGPQDLLLYSAKVIPGNETRVATMLNSLAMQGARVVAGRADNLHVSGHAYQGELEEVLRFVKPQHFLPVHGEYSFLVEHARLARERAGVQFTEVIKNGQMLGVHERRNRNTVSTGSMAAAQLAAAKAAGTAVADGADDDEDQQERGGIRVVGEVDLLRLYNDGGKGTGTGSEMALGERETLAFEGVVVAAVDVVRPKGAAFSSWANSKQQQQQQQRGAGGGGGGADGAGGSGDEARGPRLSCRARVTTRGMWTDGGRLMDTLHQAVMAAVSRLPGDAPLGLVERQVIDACMRAARWFNNRKPEVIVVAYEHDPRAGALVGPGGGGNEREQTASPVRRRSGDGEQQQYAQRRSGGGGGGSGSRSGGGSSRPWEADERRAQQQREPLELREQQREQQREQASPPRGADASSSDGSSSGGSSSSRGAPAAAAARPRPRRSSSSSTSSSSSGGKAASASATAAPRRVRRMTAASPSPPPLRVLPDDATGIPTIDANPRRDPGAAGPDADLAYD